MNGYQCIIGVIPVLALRSCWLKVDGLTLAPLGALSSNAVGGWLFRMIIPLRSMITLGRLPLFVPALSSSSYMVDCGLHSVPWD